MNRISAPVKVESRLAWFLLWMGMVLFVGALLWGMLNPHFGTMQDQTGKMVNETSDGSQAAQAGLQRVALVWEMWPLWFGLGLLYAGYRQALNESQSTPSR